MAVTGAVFWFLGAVLETSLVTFGLDPDIASWISPIAFWLGFGSFPSTFTCEIAESPFERLQSDSRSLWMVSLTGTSF